MDYINLQLLPTPQRKAPELDPKVRGFKGLKVIKEESNGQDNTVCAFSKDGKQFVVGSSTRLNLWDLDPLKSIATFERFKDIVTCAKFRDDSALLLVGDGSGKTSLINVAGKTILKRLKGHKGAVTAGAFLPLKSGKCLTAGEDRTIRVWNIAGAEEVEKWEAHSDKIRCLIQHPQDEFMFISAGYDNVIKFWDMKEECENDERKPVKVLDHGFQIESICFVPSGMMLLSAGNTSVKVWDLSKDQVTAEFEAVHGRAITSISMDSAGENILTTSLDGTAKIWNPSTYRVAHSYLLPKPGLAAQWAPNNNGLVVGMAGGWLVRRRKISTALRLKRKRPSVPDNSGVRFYKRGKKDNPDADDTIIEKKRRSKQSAVDALLRHFEYRKALVAVIQEGSEAQVYTFLDEMVQRGALINCIKNQNHAANLSILQWCLSHFPPQESVRPLYLDFVHTLLDVDEVSSCSSPAVLDLMRRLAAKISGELSSQNELKPLLGILDASLVV